MTTIAPEAPRSTVKTETQPGERKLTGLDRCDSCGAQAYAEVELLDGKLLFCGHHYTRFEAKLKPLAITVVDERAFLGDGTRKTAGNGFA